MNPKSPHLNRELGNSNPLELAKLLMLDTPLCWSADDLKSILQHELQLPLQAELGSKIDGASSDELQQSFGDLLSSPLPPLPLLRAVKEFAKANRNDPKALIPGELATMLYYAAILAARLRWRAKISELTVTDLLGGVDWALSRRWLASSLAPLFHEARIALGRPSADPI
jgi:hypothetical protein